MWAGWVHYGEQVGHHFAVVDSVMLMAKPQMFTSGVHMAL